MTHNPASYLDTGWQSLRRVNLGSPGSGANMSLYIGLPLVTFSAECTRNTMGVTMTLKKANTFVNL